MLSLVFDHLQQSGSFVAVEIAESLEAVIAQAQSADDGTVFVSPWRERAKPPANITGVHRQIVDEQLVTTFLIREHDDPRGATRARRFTAFKKQIEKLLAGWQPEAGGFSMALVGGEATGLGNGVSLYAQTWQISRFLTGAQT